MLIVPASQTENPEDQDEITKKRGGLVHSRVSFISEQLLVFCNSNMCEGLFSAWPTWYTNNNHAYRIMNSSQRTARANRVAQHSRQSLT